jgi:serine/threonine protein kinase
VTPGTKFGPYEILAPVGAGGMGEVYRARDCRLRREVALKVLPPEMQNDPARRARFEQEARAIGALNHPGIVTIHDIGNSDGTLFIVTELIDGQSLRQMIEQGPLPLRAALNIGIQVESSGSRIRPHRTSRPETRKYHGDARWPGQDPDFDWQKPMPRQPQRAIP